MSGQALIETALVLPVLLFLLLGIIGAGYLFLQAMRDQQGVIVLAQYAATETGWRSHVVEIDRQSGCHAEPLQPSIADGLMTWDCHLRTGWMFDGLLLQVQAIVGPSPRPTTSPGAS